MKHFIALLILMQAACGAHAQRVATYESKTHTFKVHIDSSAKDTKNYDCHIKLVVIYNKPDANVLQTITPPENSVFCGAPAGKAFLTPDINFDGVNDFMIAQFIPAAPNVPYYYWRFNAKTKQFQRDTTLDDITSPNFDPDNKTITSFWRSGCCDNGVSTYQYINGELTLVEATELSQDPENEQQQIFTHKKLINGDLKLIETNTQKKQSSSGQK